MNTFRAAYIPAELGATAGGLLLTTEEQCTLPADELMAAARAFAVEVGAEGEIVIGDWRE